jgi:hypothetical protein
MLNLASKRYFRWQEVSDAAAAAAAARTGDPDGARRLMEIDHEDACLELLIASEK